MDKADKFWKWEFVLLLAFVVVVTVIYSLKIESHSTYVTYSTPTAQVTSEPTVTPTEAPQPTAEPQLIKITSLGEFKFTYYTNSYADCKKTDGITFSGVRAVEGITIAADLSVIPMGTYVYLEGVGIRIVQDIGGAVKGNLIDIYVDKKSDKLPGKGNVYLLGGVK